MECPYCKAYCGGGTYCMREEIGTEPTDIGFNILVSCECRDCGKAFVLRQPYMMLEECETITMEEYEESE